MADKKHTQDNDLAQNINAKTWQDSNKPLSSEQDSYDNDYTENIPQLTAEEQANQDKKRNDPKFQNGLQNILAENKEVVQAKEDPENLSATIKGWQDEMEPVDSEQTNATGLPDKLKQGIEQLSGISMDDVTVHYNSSKPAEIGALAYAQDSVIYVGPGQEKHLPHEAWHIVQQKQNRVKATTQMKGAVDLNDNDSLEKEADVMGAKASKEGDKKDLAQPKLKKEGNKKGVAQALMDLSTFQSSSSKTRRHGFLWLQTEEVRIEPAETIANIDTKLQSCHDTKEGDQNTYYQNLQDLLTFLKEKGGEVQNNMPNIKGMQLMGEKVPEEAKIYDAAITGLIEETERDVAEAEAAKKETFKTFSEGTEEERQDRLDFMKIKYGSHAHLLADIPLNGTEKAALQKMLENFYSRPDFTYTTGASGSFSKKGNCMTLANEFKDLAVEALGIAVTSPGYKTGPFKVPTRKIVGADMTSNIDGGAGEWVWEQHACAEFKGEVIDVLYGMWGGMESVTGSTTGSDPDMFYTFNSENIYLAKDEFFNNEWKSKYTKDPEKANFTG